ncbi:unnamed protein product [Porites lobata]|uniref:Uncharacterized protein n=1 Tax=Porites lobata TaxID=104759 RepID=A0ABN8NF48_9CNID|nr:unnamed protein product [Porites lobata]
MSLAISHDSYDDFRVCFKRVESRLRTLNSMLTGETDMWYERSHKMLLLVGPAGVVTDFSDRFPYTFIYFNYPLI